MAWTIITAICGHTYREQQYGPHRGRESRTAWLEGRDCPDCYTERKKAEHAAASAIAAENNKAADLPALTGSPKQIAWAETIRAEKIAQLNALAARLAGGSNEGKVAMARTIIADRIARTSAKYWIDNRTQEYDQEWVLAAVAKKTEAIVL